MYIRNTGARFSVEASQADDRVNGHPKRQSVQCYYGVPLFGPKGKMLGTVCHFDVLPVRVTEEIAAALDDLSPLIVSAAFQSKTIA